MTDPSDRLFGWRHAFDHPATVMLTVGAGAAIAVAVVVVLSLGNRLAPKTRSELWRRIGSWCVLLPVMVGPVLLGAAFTMAAVAVLSLFCYREFARATGLFRERGPSLLAVLGILAVTFATVDHWYGLFLALFPLVSVLIVGLAVAADQPQGYIQRTALAIYGFVLFGVCLGHLGYFANDAGYRPMVLFLLFAVELNDVFAYTCGRLFGRRKLMPLTSPNKTVAGAVGALLCTTALTLLLGPVVFRGSEVEPWYCCLGLGLLIGVGGQLGDLVLSAIKRDLGIKDFAATIPGHGGLLDRFDSLLLVAPAAFHFIGYLRGIGLDEPVRILSGGS